MISGEQGLFLIEREAHVVRGVARGVHPTHRPSVTHGRDLTIADTHVGVEFEVGGLLQSDALLDLARIRSVGLDAAVRTEGDRGSTRLLAQPCGQRRVVGVAMGHQDRPDAHAFEAGGQGVAMFIEHRPRVDHGDVVVADDVGARSQVGVLRRVVGDHSPHER